MLATHANHHSRVTQEPLRNSNKNIPCPAILNLPRCQFSNNHPRQPGFADHRTDEPNLWEPPGGKPGESLFVTVRTHLPYLLLKASP